MTEKLIIKKKSFKLFVDGLNTSLQYINWNNGLQVNAYEYLNNFLPLFEEYKLIGFEFEDTFFTAVLHSLVNPVYVDKRLFQIAEFALQYIAEVRIPNVKHSDISSNQEPLNEIGQIVYFYYNYNHPEKERTFSLIKFAQRLQEIQFSMMRNNPELHQKRLLYHGNFCAQLFAMNNLEYKMDSLNNQKLEIINPTPHAPLLITLTILQTEEREIIINAFHSFKTKFIHTEELRCRNREQILQNFKKFILNNQVKISQLITIMKENAFIFLESYLASTSVTLERIINNINVFPKDYVDLLINVFEKYKGDILLNNYESTKRWEVVLNNISSHLTVHDKVDSIQFDYHDSLMVNHWEYENLLEIEPADSEEILKNRIKCEKLQTLIDQSIVLPNLINLLSTALNDSTTLINFFNSISKQAQALTLKLLGVNSEEIDPDLSSRFDLDYLPKLGIAKLCMEMNTYQAIFNEMLKLDLKGENVMDFMRNTNQTNELGKKLALYNQNIHKQLNHAGINVQLAMEYNKKIAFFTEKTSGLFSIKQIKITLLADISQLSSAIKKMIEKEAVSLLELTKLKKIQEYIKTLKNNVAKGGGAVLIKTNNYDLLKLIKNNLNFILCPSSNEHINHFIECKQHYIERFDLLTEQSSQYSEIKVSEITKAKSFTVEQWDKNNMSTYLLGKYVGCCLDFDGGQFGALIQRRMDDAMFFHVVLDTETNLPIALTWLYFSMNANEPNTIYIIANFVEMAAKYAADPALQARVLRELFTFTEQYSKDIGAGGFLINHLNYGWIKDFTCFEQKYIKPQKVGGFLNLDTDTDLFDNPKERYYLNSLDCSVFHEYQMRRFENAYLSTQTPTKTALINNSLFENKNAVSQSVTKHISSHRVDQPQGSII